MFAKLSGLQVMRHKRKILNYHEIDRVECVRFDWLNEFVTASPNLLLARYLCEW